MTHILSIETSTKVCSVAVHQDGKYLVGQVHHVDKSHSSLLPSLALEVLEELEMTLNDMDAFAVSSGPGSYTGLRIGLSTVKGFCFALSKPLISVPSLKALSECLRGKFLGDHILIPMMDARRMEVYTTAENQQQEILWPQQAKILESNSFEEFKIPTYLFGDGMPKFREISTQENLIFIDDIFPDAKYMGEFAYRKFENADFEDLAYFEPNYLKEWRTTTPKKKLL